MASQKMMRSTIALFLTINLVFFGFTVAQAPAPQDELVCPRSLLQLQTCINAVPLGGLLNRPIAPCCNLVAGLTTPVATLCICNALRLRFLNILTINMRLGEIIGLCGFAAPPAGFSCP